MDLNIEHKILEHHSYFSMQASTCTGIKFLKSAEDGSAVHIVTVQCMYSCTVIKYTVCVSMFLTDTLSTNILSVAHVTLTAVACGCGNAASIQTQVGEMFAHINGVVHRNRA